MGSVKRERTAAWRITAGGVLVLAFGSAFAFLLLQNFLVRDMQRRADRWLLGELGQLTNVVERTPDGLPHDTIIREVAEFGSKEVPYDGEVPPHSRSAFFLLTQADGRMLLHTEAAEFGPELLSSLRASCDSDGLCSVKLSGFAAPVRVARSTLSSGQHMFLGLSSDYEGFFLRRLQVRFTSIWLLVLGMSATVLFLSTRQMLMRVENVTEAAASIGRENLKQRVLFKKGQDEISRLSSTVNQMLDRIEETVQQMNTMSDAIAHDIRTPLTTLRGRLELMLYNEDGVIDERIPPLIEGIDRLTNLLSVSLDISEAHAQALRMSPKSFDLSDLLVTMTALYEPLLNEAGITMKTCVTAKLIVFADPTLLERAFMNLLDNGVNYSKPGSQLTVSLTHAERTATIVFEDTGPGFPAEILSSALEPFRRGRNSRGSGLGLAFVAAVIRMQGGTVQISNVPSGGAAIVLQLPM